LASLVHGILFKTFVRGCGQPVAGNVLVSDYSRFVENQILAPLKTIPPLEIHNGEISFDGPMPFIVRSKTGAVVAMIDTRQNGNEMEKAYPELMLQVTKDKFYFRAPTVHLFPDLAKQSQPAKPMHVPLVKMPDKNTSGVVVIREWLESQDIFRLKWMMALLIYPFVVAAFFGFFYTFLLVLAMLAQGFSAAILRYRMKFTDTVRVLIVASTVQLSVLLLFLSAHLIFPALGIICVALCVIYYSYGVLSVKRESRQLVNL
jgi:hypothetical protein